MILVLFLLLNTLTVIAVAQDSGSMTEPDYKVLAESVDSTILMENESLRDLKDKLSQLQNTQLAIDTEINTYKVQFSTHGNLLLLPQTDIKDLEKARSGNRIAFENVELRIKDLKQKESTIRLYLEQTEDQIKLNKDQLESLKAVKTDGQKVRAAMKDFAQLLKLLSAKLEVLKEMQSIYLNSLNQFEAIFITLEELSIKFEQQISYRKKQFLLSRTPSPLALLNGEDINKELRDLNTRAKQFFVKETWQKELRTDWKSGRALLLSLSLIYCFFQFLLMRLHRYLSLHDSQDRADGIRYQHIAVRMVKQSLYLFGLAAFAYLYTSLSGLYATIPFVKLSVLIVSIILFTRWGHGFLSIWLQAYPWLPKKSARLLHGLLIFIRYYSIVYLAVGWLLASDSVLLLAGRIMLEVFLLIWVIVFWKIHNQSIRRPDAKPSKVYYFLSSVAYGIVGAGVILELLGYGGLSNYWFASWGLSIIFITWSSLTFLVLREWRQTFKGLINDENEASPKPVYLIRWLLLQLGWIVWLSTSALLLVISWGGKKTVIINFFKLLTGTVTIGSISISLMNVAYAFLILILTRTLARFWRYFLKEKILLGSGMDIGLQNSITMISVYSFWAFGIILSLHVFGFGTASLAVGFGALGIGLGFGLQNIFSNFISGIIMLIERPIQVGDDVEINGTWATVKKINVRSTIVQTYDNASLIIPNSEFVSQQVKNWSFKDKRLRVKIDVGVAYGSDIELVRETLLEIADKTPKVFKQRTPDVIFRDFGDSALIFRLRVWTDIDNMFKVETAIRFEIDRLFKERGIVIAFPQRDVHIFPEKGNVMD